MTTFTQVTARLKEFLKGRLLVLGLKEGLVESATVCVNSWVILTGTTGINNANNVHNVNQVEIMQQQQQQIIQTYQVSVGLR